MKQTLIDRFLAGFKFNNFNVCWEWIKYKNPAGYGKISYRHCYNIYHKCYYAHRLSWMIFHGPIPEEMCVCHKCDNTSCVNPEHLFLGTHKDNIQDCIIKKRRYVVKLAGIFNPNSNFSKQDVFNIFRMKYCKNKNGKEIAKIFNVCHSSICRILSGETYKKEGNKAIEKLKELEELL